MRYFATASSPAVRDAMDRGMLGQIVTPRERKMPTTSRLWCADNGVFGGSYPGDQAYLRWLARLLEHAERCSFVVAPDVVCDAAATLERSAPLLEAIRALGLPAALAAQNGLEHLPVPWPTFDCLFIGGDTAWKLGPAARWLILEAHHRGKTVHMGRVNSWRRLRYARQAGCDSADGTYLAFGPDRNLPRLLAWLGEVETQGMLW